MISDGDLFRKIRKEKGISQQTICRNVLSRTTLSKFENNKINLSIKLFIYLLDCVDISFDEFSFIKNDFSTSEKHQIYLEFFSLFSNRETELLYELEKRCTRYLEVHYSKLIENILLIVESQLSLATKKSNQNWCLPKVLVTTVWNDVQKKEYWTLSEIRIVNCCLFLFEIETARSIGTRLLYLIDFYDVFTDIYPLKCSILLNLSLLYLEDRNFQQATSFSNQAVSVSRKAKRYDYYAISLLRNGLSEKSIEKINEAILIAELIKEESLVTLLKEEKQLYFIQS